MSTTPQQNGSTPKPKAPAGKKEVKVLMLHGYTQSGPLFRAKTRALEKILTKSLGPISILPVFFYPTAPNRLRPQDIPGYEPAPGSEGQEEQIDSWAWFRKNDATGEYRYFNEGMAAVAEAIKEAGGVDAVCGFSQGGAVTGIVAAALESGRAAPEGAEGEWARKLREANGGQPLKFAVSYSGFWAPVDKLQWCYEPKITTPTLHYLGSLDTVVEESRTQALIDRCESPLVVTHPGGHYVPVSKEWALPLAGFIKQYTERELKSEL
ncbi:unnamed protein product [Clonostachys rhizophaga]|uniref:Serine hydrolase domain-containing protein n=1 Tax=Clonostachys rhizophaga TaxID=160324 RepID=A0A9N9YMZ3_9HYPO|nr:unnamed protein product [Clonostachys rhizophaga]